MAKGNFCSTCQTVSEHPEIFGAESEGFQFSQSTESKQKSFSSFINEAIDALGAISAFGTEGTKNPTQDELDSLQKVAKEERILATHFNQLLTVLKIENEDIKSKDKLLGSYATDLQTYIENYQLNEDRCNSCNSTCNSDESCSESCGQCSAPGTNCLSYICGVELGCGTDTCNVGAQGCGSEQTCDCQSSSQTCSSSNQSGCDGYCQAAGQGDCNICQSNAQCSGACQGNQSSECEMCLYLE